MRVIGQWDSLIQLLTTESAQELMGNSHSRSALAPGLNILVKKTKKIQNKEHSFWWIVCRFKYIFWAPSKKDITL